MNQSFAGLFSVMLLLAFLFIGGGVIASQLYQELEHNQALQKELTSKQETVSNLNNDITKKNAEIQDLKAQLNESQQRRQQAENKAANAQSQVTDLTQKLSAAQAERDRLTQQDHELLDRITALTAQVQDLQNRLNAAPQPEIVNSAATTRPPEPAASPLGTLVANSTGTLATWFFIFASGFLVSGLGLTFRRNAPPAPAPTVRPTAIPDPLDLSAIYPAQRKDNHPAPQPIADAGVHPNDHPTAPLKLTRITDPNKSRAQHWKENR